LVLRLRWFPYLPFTCRSVLVAVWLPAFYDGFWRPVWVLPPLAGCARCCLPQFFGLIWRLPFATHSIIVVVVVVVLLLLLLLLLLCVYYYYCSHCLFPICSLLFPKFVRYLVTICSFVVVVVHLFPLLLFPLLVYRYLPCVYLPFSFCCHIYRYGLGLPRLPFPRSLPAAHPFPLQVPFALPFYVTAAFTRCRYPFHVVAAFYRRLIYHGYRV